MENNHHNTLGFSLFWFFMRSTIISTHYVFQYLGSPYGEKTLENRTNFITFTRHGVKKHQYPLVFSIHFAWYDRSTWKSIVFLNAWHWFCWKNKHISNVLSKETQYTLEISYSGAPTTQYALEISVLEFSRDGLHKHLRIWPYDFQLLWYHICTNHYISLDRWTIFSICDIIFAKIFIFP